MKIIFLLFLFFPFSFSQTISNNRIEKIVDLLIANSKDISNYIYPAELKTSNRFGIEYDGIENKYFIANDIPKEFSNNLLNVKLKYEYQLKNLEDNFSLLTFTIPTLNFTREYYLKELSIVSSPFYHSHKWKNIVSEHFNFFISDETLFNKYSIDQLEIFINKMIGVLSLTDEEATQLKTNKIFYFFCKDEDEIKKVTGFATRGIYILAQDYIVTTYNTHYHELLHFLINFKLKYLPLYTHPFLQEGFAVAYGGRGGLDAHAISEMGVFLIKSGFANYTELLNKSDFQKTDATISYPISGLYTNFLISMVGITQYLNLYIKYSGTADNTLKESIITKDILPEEQWNLFIDSLLDKNPVSINEKLELNDYKLITQQIDFEIYENSEQYFFRIKDTLLISTAQTISNYRSKIFYKHFPNKNYNSEKYLIIANQNEISVYNLFSNNLIGKYVESFSIPPKAVLQSDGFYEFVVNKDLFDEKESKDLRFKI